MTKLEKQIIKETMKRYDCEGKSEKVILYIAHLAGIYNELTK